VRASRAARCPLGAGPLFPLLAAWAAFGVAALGDPALAGSAAAESVSQARGFSFEERDNRWWVVDPDERTMLARAVSKVDTADWGGSGGSLSYDAVYVQPTGQAASRNLAAAAADTAPADVVDTRTRTTLSAAGDALLLGSTRFRPNYTYFWLERPASGGKVTWYYSTAPGRSRGRVPPNQVRTLGPQRLNHHNPGGASA